jgi:c-di-AMP phosphodiesterase-like protein
LPFNKTSINDCRFLCFVNKFFMFAAEWTVNMKRKRVWQFMPMVAITAVVLIIFSLISLFWDYRIALAEFIAALLLIVSLVLRMGGIQKDIRSMLSKTVEGLDVADRQSLIDFPLSVLVIGKTGEIVWYNDRFRDSVIGGVDYFGADVKTIAKNLNLEAFTKPDTAADVITGNKRYTVYGSDSQRGFFVLYWIDNTELKNVVDEYRESRPVVAIVMIDNYDELMQNAREGEKGEIVNMIEKTLLSWVSTTTGFIRHSDRDKYIFLFEERHLKKLVEQRFDILDKVRQIVAGDRMPATLSIGIGRGADSFAQGEESARQALDMALGRGGDQAAVKTPGGFDFYGGTSKAVEKRTKVKTRIIASALAELIDGSENVLIMGHKNPDLDVLGASVALYKAIISRDRPVKIVMSERGAPLLRPSIDQLVISGYAQAFIEPDESLQLMTRKTLLIIVDTHRKGFIEYPDLYKAAKTVAVIDHHRKMVDFIDNAIIFYHEPYASSASEMVAELVQYIADSAITPLEAGAMLAGMTLDTRNFTVRTGVRTFEAAAYLRHKGADTARVKLLFSGSMESYKKRSRLVSLSETYKGCAISVYDGDSDDELKLIAPQAADDLLTITGISASFVIYPNENGVAVSSRSMGAVNVQLVMEALGGGGHLTMAGVQLVGVSLATVKAKIKASIDKYFEENKLLI